MLSLAAASSSNSGGSEGFRRDSAPVSQLCVFERLGALALGATATVLLRVPAQVLTLAHTQGPEAVVAGHCRPAVTCITEGRMLSNCDKGRVALYGEEYKSWTPLPKFRQQWVCAGASVSVVGLLASGGMSRRAREDLGLRAWW